MTLTSSDVWFQFQYGSNFLASVALIDSRILIAAPNGRQLISKNHRQGDKYLESLITKQNEMYVR